MRDKETKFSNGKLRQYPHCNGNSVITGNRIKTIMHKLVVLPISLSIAFAVSLQGTSTPSRVELDHQKLFSSKVQEIASGDGKGKKEVFSREHIYFDGNLKGKEENCNKDGEGKINGRKDGCRIATKTVRVLEVGQEYKNVTMNLKLECPNGNKCDWYDRAGYVAVKKDGNNIEIMRFKTPYGGGGINYTWTSQVTELQPLLKGNVQLELFIDTWVQPGHQQGDGWLATVSFDFEEGSLSERPVQVIPLWNEQDLKVGNKEEIKLETPELSIPGDANRVELRSLITGHGQGNNLNCAEFCPQTHSYTVGKKKYSSRVWRDNCAENPFLTSLTAENKKWISNWTGSRAGWCPGDIVNPWVIDVTEVAQPGTTVQVKYGIEGIEQYNKEPYIPNFQGERTDPFYRTSTVLIIYK